MNAVEFHCRLPRRQIGRGYHSLESWGERERENIFMNERERYIHSLSVRETEREIEFKNREGDNLMYERERQGRQRQNVCERLYTCRCGNHWQ